MKHLVTMNNAKCHGGGCSGEFWVLGRLPGGHEPHAKLRRAKRRKPGLGTVRQGHVAGGTSQGPRVEAQPSAPPGTSPWRNAGPRSASVSDMAPAETWGAGAGGGAGSRRRRKWGEATPSPTVDTSGRGCQSCKGVRPLQEASGARGPEEACSVQEPEGLGDVPPRQPPPRRLQCQDARWNLNAPTRALEGPGRGRLQLGGVPV